MAGEYQPTLNPGALGTDYSGAPSSLGQSTAQALEYGGELMDKDIHQFKEVHRDMEAASAGVQLAQASQQLDQAAIDARSNAGPGGAGHTQAIDQQFAQVRDQALGQIRDPHIRQAYAQRWAELGSQISTREYGWEAATRADYIRTNVGNAAATINTSQFSNRDSVAFVGGQNQIVTLWNTQSGIPDDVKQQGIKEDQRQGALNFADGWLSDDTKDPQHIIDALKDPAFNQYLEKGDQEALQSKAAVEIRRRDMLANAAAERQKAADAADISLAKDKISSGYIPTESDWQTWQTEATRSGLDKDQFDLGVLKDQAQINQQFKGVPPPQINQAVNELAAKEHNGKLTPAEQIHLNNLRDFAAKQTALYNSDIYRFEAANGNVAPQLDPNDPSSYTKRIAWADALKKGDPTIVNSPYLSNDEAKSLTDEIKTGPAGQMKAAAELRKFGIGVGSQIAGTLMTGEQGQDLKLQIGFPDRVAEWYSRGVSAQTGKTVHVGSTDQATYQEDQQAISDALSQVNGAIPVDMRPAIRRAAINVAAGMAAELGMPTLQGDQLKQFMNAAIQRVTGRGGVVSDWNAKGGVAKWNDRPDGSPGYIWLPQGESTNSAFSKMSRAGKADWIQAAGGAPYIMGTNGKPTPLSDAQISQIRKYPLDLLPSSSGQSIPGVYTPITPDGGHLVTKDGKPWQFDVRKLR